MRQLFLDLEMNRMGGKDTVFGAAWRRGSGGFAGTPERHKVQPAAVVEAALRAAVAPRGEAVGLRQEEGWTAQRAAVQEGEASTAVAGAVCGRGVNAEKGPDPNADCWKILAGFFNDWKNLSRVFQRLGKFLREQRSFCWLCSLLPFAGCLAPAPRPQNSPRNLRFFSQGGSSRWR